MTGIPIRLLLVEDSEDDVLLLLRELRKGGYDPDYQQVDTLAGLQHALQGQTWDLVITDHNLPGFDCTATLEMVREIHQDLPIIIVSGSIGEDIAVGAMRSGASDYIMKDKLARLAPAIQRELREKEMRRARRQAEAIIQHLAFHDSLTGLVNRTEFERRLNNAIDCAQRDQGHHALLYMDLDQFKLVNDTCGHAAGDELLKQLSSLLHHRIRESDTLSRVGGDEFCLLLENCGIDQAQDIADELRGLVQDFRFLWQNKMFSLGISIGIVAIDRNTCNSGEILSAADMACYAAKDKGRNCIHVYREQDIDMLRRRGEMDWAARIDEALGNDRLLLYQQSIVSLNDTTAHAPHCEVLLRMRSENNHIIAPGAFIPAAERYQRMTAIDRWVIAHTLSFLEAINLTKERLININLSGQSLSDEALFAFVSDKLQQHQIDPQNICFEITETAAIANFQNALAFIDQIKSLGCRIALDDFGSGMSSFSYLKSLQVDYLKIDGAFVRNIVQDGMDKAIVEAINSIGHKAGIKTIAEYVESEDIMEQLREIGVDYAQGFAINKPVPFSKD